MANDKKYKGVYLDKKTNKYYVSTTFTTRDGVALKRCKRGFDTARKAELWKVKTALEISQQSIYAIDGASNPMERVIDDYLRYSKGHLKVSTLKQRELFLKRYFAPHFKSPSEITVKQITDYYMVVCSWNIKTISKNTRISNILAFVEYMDLMELLGVGIYNKFKLIFKKLPQTEESSASFIELEDFRKLINTFEETELMAKVFFEFLFFTGVRKGEALALKYSDLNLETNTVFINKQRAYQSEVSSSNGFETVGVYVLLPFTKTNQNKNIVLPNWLVSDILSLKDKFGCCQDLIFSTEKDGALPSTYFRLILNKHLEEVGLPHIRIHDFRHSHITLLYDMNVDGKYVAERLGHSSEKTSHLVYEHITKKKRARNDEIVSQLKL